MVRIKTAQLSSYSLYKYYNKTSKQNYLNANIIYPFTNKRNVIWIAIPFENRCFKEKILPLCWLFIHTFHDFKNKIPNSSNYSLILLDTFLLVRWTQKQTLLGKNIPQRERTCRLVYRFSEFKLFTNSFQLQESVRQHFDTPES